MQRVDPQRLPELTQLGFYRPSDRGLTIIGNDEMMFEIPINDLPTATLGEYRDLLHEERSRAVALPRLKRVTQQQPASRNASNDAIGIVTGGARVKDTTAGIPAGDNLVIDDVANVEELLIDGVSKVESEAEQAKAERQKEIEESENLKKVWLIVCNWLAQRRLILANHLRGSGVSIVIHVAIFLLLASLALVQEQEAVGLFISATPASEDVIDEVVIEPSPLEITEPTETDESEAPPESEEMPMEMAEAINAPNFLANVSGDAIAPPAVPSPDAGMGNEMPKKQSKVFGTARAATDYVFVIDNSNSMTRGRFETALYELMTAINSLTPKQNFFIIFYSDTAYAMMHPKPVSKLVAATPRNKQIVNVWLNTVPLCLKTNGKEAIELAFRLNPDVIYVLGDGAFTDRAGEHFAKRPRGKTIVHCRGMEVDANKAKQFEALAKAHGGNYKDVGVHPYAAELAKKKPRPRNNTRNGYWGLKLPVRKGPKP